MRRAQPPGRLSTGDKVAFLCSPESYPERPHRQSRVDVIETHMSWVFLTQHLVYKLKKPAHYDFLDFSTLAARRRNSEREVELNRRLAGSVYRSTVPLTASRDGHLRLGGEGRVIDWLVVMRRLPAERMLDNAIASDSVTAGDVTRLARLLSKFYHTATPAPTSAERQRRHFAAAIEANRAELLKPRYGLPARLIHQVTTTQLEFVAAHGELLAPRAHRRVDAHGDLRPEHVCLTPQPVIIDCLEFNRQFRLLDPTDELAYFAMECARLGNAALGDTVLSEVLRTLRDVPDENLIRFYKAFRATMRAKIAIWHLADRHINHTAHWRRRARASILPWHSVMGRAARLLYAPQRAREHVMPQSFFQLREDIHESMDSRPPHCGVLRLDVSHFLGLLDYPDCAGQTGGPRIGGQSLPWVGGSVSSGLCCYCLFGWP